MPFSLNTIVAQLPSLDIARTSRFYQQLGFREVGVYPDFLMLELSGHGLHFWLTDDRNLCENSSCYLSISGIHAFYEQLPASLKHPRAAPRACAWGMTECYIHDPDGNLLKCGEPTPQVAAARQAAAQPA